MNLAEGEAAVFCRRIAGDMVAIIGDNRKLLVFKLEEIPTMARGRGVTLQNIKTAECPMSRYSKKKKALFIPVPAEPKPRPICWGGSDIAGR